MTFTVYTVGHSTRTQEEFLELLQSFGIECLADVRAFAASRKYPQFHADAMRSWLGEAGIRYVHLPGLGGRRRKSPGPSPNTAWRNVSFRNYADYALTAPFRQALRELLETAEESRTAICCSEAVYWRCHRSIVSDFLVARGVPVEHIMAPGTSRPHELRDFAKRVGTDVIYPGTT